MTDDPVEPPRVPAPTETLIMTNDEQHQLLWIEGLLPLPIGSRINLDNVPGLPQIPLERERFPTGRADAVVVGVRLWGAVAPSRCLVLLVELTGPGEEGTWMVQT